MTVVQWPFGAPLALGATEPKIKQTNNILTKIYVKMIKFLETLILGQCSHSVRMLKQQLRLAPMRRIQIYTAQVM